MLVPIKLRSTGGFRVVAMPDRNILQADGAVQLPQCFLKTSFGNNVVTRNVNVTRIDAGSYRHVVPEMLDDFGNLLKAAAE